MRSNAGANGQLQRCAAPSVEFIDGGAAFQEELHRGWTCAPRGHVKGGAVRGDAEVAVARIERANIHPQVEKVTDALGVSVSSELGKKSSAIFMKFGAELRFSAE